MTIDAHDDKVTTYLISNYGELCTDTEKKILRALNLKLKANQASSQFAKRKLGDAAHLMDDPQVRSAVESGDASCRLKIRDRLMRDHADDIALNRCPICTRLTRTPRARMCVHCGHACHAKNTT